MPTTITSAGVTFNDATTLTSANIGSSQIAANAVGATQIAANAVGATQIANGSVTAAKLGITEQKQICKAWVNFDGTTSPGTIRSSYNVSSVTKNGTGDYTVNFTTAMTDANYSVNVTGTSGSTNATSGLYGTLFDNLTPRTSSLFRVTTLNNSSAATDCAFVSISVFGN